MDTTRWTEVVSILVGLAGALLGLAGALVVSFWRGATLAQTITRAITESEERLRNENRLLGEKVEGLKVEVAVLSTKIEERGRGRTPSPYAVLDPAQLASRLGPDVGGRN